MRWDDPRKMPGWYVQLTRSMKAAVVVAPTDTAALELLEKEAGISPPIYQHMELDKFAQENPVGIYKCGPKMKRLIKEYKLKKLEKEVSEWEDV